MIDLPYISAVSQPDSVIDIPPSNVLLDTAANTSDAPLVLLAEDNEANIATISSYLIAKDYRVVFAKNGQEAIALAKSHHPDLILMDVQMPVMDGLEATRQIRCDPDLINIPIIALTALAMSGDREKCLTAGASEYLTKPVKLKALSQMIQTFLAH
jgi:CheY-like chemotaxis protein